MILIISTEKNAKFSLGLANKRLIDFVVVEKPYQQSELLLKTLDRLLKKNNYEIGKLKEIIVVDGPGDFSALRIGIATANILGFGLKKKVVGVRLNDKMKLMGEEDKLKELLKLGLKKKVLLGNIVKPFYGAEPHITVKKK